MSILIKGMKKPNRCIDCPFMISRDNDDCILQSNVANALFMNWDDMKLNCPLVELPEKHGRLIDADALADNLDYDAMHYEEDHEMKANCASWLRSRAAPTIIEAEGDEWNE